MEVKGKGRIGIARSITCLGSKEEESEDMLWGGERGAEGNRKEKMQREKRSKKEILLRQNRRVHLFSSSLFDRILVMR